ncbi:phage tail protein [Salinisphaera sp.]|uniref:phage tail protein n=1 Tax=Salinisphaera sp. TaxID=1914330 RepID=UPI000C4F14C4|nr:tail fiber protein [Salinisphaera sp.]MAS09927.1 hypothetical protein [Salinisphaera sp.]|tara:strand:+ start:622 stop:1725 length:1104 start_codon:yes stop_codon:yes gene_type:complete
MPWNGKGVFSRDNGSFSGSSVWGQDRNNNVNIRADRHDTHDQDLADGIQNCITKDGQNTPSKNLPMGGFRHINVGDGQSPDDYAALGQIQRGSLFYGGPDTGTTNSFRLALSPAIDNYQQGQIVVWQAQNDNDGPATLNINGVGADDLQLANGEDLKGGEIAPGDWLITVYSGSNWRLLTSNGEKYLPIYGGTVTGDLDINGNLTVEDGPVAYTPVGQITMFGGSDDPNGWLICDGREVSRSEYDDLYDVLGTVYGNGDGNSTFNLPDFRGRAPVGAGRGVTEDDDGDEIRLTRRERGERFGEERHTQTEEELAPHAHDYYTPSDDGFSGDGGQGGNPYLNTTEEAGGGEPFNVMQPSLVVNYIIKT